MNVQEQAISGLLRFAIERIDHTTGKQSWLPNFLTFEVLDDGKEYGSNHTTENSPIQEFLWGGYTVQENRTYTYRVTVMYGQPGALVRGDTVEVKIATEDRSTSTHAIYFNRGVAVSQAYVRKFGTKSPEEVPDRAAYQHIRAILWTRRSIAAIH